MVLPAGSGERRRPSHGLPAGFAGLDRYQPALALIKRECPDVLISDLRMSGLSGHQLQLELKRVAPNLPVIIITAFGSIQTAVESMKLGAFDYITKPFSNDELLLVVTRALEAPPAPGGAAAARRTRAQLRIAQHHRDQSADGRGVGDAQAGRRQPRQRAVDGRERHRQRPARPRAAFSKARAATAPLSRSTARRCPRPSSKANCSATSAAHSPTRARRTAGCSRQRVAARCSWTKSAKCRWACKLSCCA